jgi:hypothetical protein
LIRKWRLKHRAVADSLEEAGDRLFTFTRLPPSQWRSARTTNAIERLREEFKRRIKTQTVLPSAETAAMLFWALLASGQINMRKVDGWQTLSAKLIDQPIDLAAQNDIFMLPEMRHAEFQPLSGRHGTRMAPRARIVSTAAMQARRLLRVKSSRTTAPVACLVLCQSLLNFRGPAYRGIVPGYRLLKLRRLVSPRPADPTALIPSRAPRRSAKVHSSSSPGRYQCIE